MSKAINDVLAERKRQINVKGWTTDHDDGHQDGELELAALCYIVHGQSGFAPEIWPWDSGWKPKSRRQNLVRAGALRLAEKQRLERKVIEADDLLNNVIDGIERLDRGKS